MFGADLPFNIYIHDEEPAREDNGWNFDLPNYLTPSFHQPHPWNRQHASSSNLHMDFILIAEFSELEGPREVMTIPKEGAEGFNITEFSVRIMSLDHQTTTKQGFHIIEDSQVMFTEISDRVYAFVHHFVLYDRHARGFVRPFAISYITPDSRKLLHFYEEISQHMKRIVRYMKYGNKLVFKNDLEMHMMDLHYTKAQMLLKKRSSHVSEPINNDDIVLRNLKMLETMLTETQNILKVIRPSLTDKKLEQRFVRLEEKAKIDPQRPKSDSFSLQEWHDIENPITPISGSLGNAPESTGTLFPDNRFYKPKIVKISTGRQFDGHLQGFHELCSWGHREGMQRLRHMYQFFKRDISILLVEQTDKSFYEPSSALLHFGENCVTANFMTNVDKNCVGSCCMASDFPGMMMNKWSSMDTLDSFKSAASSFRSVIEDDIESMKSACSARGSPQTANTTITNEVTVDDENDMDFFSNEILRNLVFQTQEIEAITKLAANKKDKSVLVDDYQEHQNQVEIDKTNFKHLEYMEESSLAYQKPDSKPIPRMHTDIEDDPCMTCKDCEQNLNRDDPTKENVSVDDTQLLSHNNIEKKHLKIASDTAIIGKSDTKMNDSIKDDPTIENVSVDDTQLLSHNIIEKRCMNITSDTADIEKCDTKMNDNLDDMNCQKNFHPDIPTYSTLPEDLKREMSTSSTLEDLLSPNISNLEPSELLFPNIDTFTSGFGLLKMMNTYNNMTHIIYSLLIGRTVIVIGTKDMEDEIKHIVKALRIFLTTSHRNPRNSIPFTCKIPELSRISEIKLLGIGRPERKAVERFLPITLQKLCTIFDVKKREIHAPLYQGYFLNVIASRARNFQVEDMLTTFVKSILVDIASKVFLFFHSVCIGPAGINRNESSSVKQQSHSLQNTVCSFMSKIGVHNSDIHIIEHLAETIKQQFIEEHYQINGFSCLPVKPINAHHQACSRMLPC